MNTLEVNIKSRAKQYPIYIDNADFSVLRRKILQECGDKNYIVVFNQKVYKLYSKEFDFPKDRIFILKDGEQEKNYKNYLKILDFALSKKLKREDYIIAIGGGVVGDIAGFAASTYMRGINFIQVPTTLLAMTDSSVGGKVAINTNYGKNLVGAFYQPKVVFINTNFLKTLDINQYKSGLGEVIKYGFIEKSCDEDSEFDLLNFLNGNCEKILNKDSYTMERLISACVQLKIKVVENDEKESGLRKILNYGHTYAHAVEKLTNYRKYTHGECVIEGIKFALNLAVKKNLINKEYHFLCSDIIQKYEYKPLKAFVSSKYIPIMTTDKKATGDCINFILPVQYAQVGEYKFTVPELFELVSDNR